MARSAWGLLLFLLVTLLANCGDDGGPNNHECVCDEACRQFASDHYSRVRFFKYVRDTIAAFTSYSGFEPCTDPGGYDSAACWTAIREVFPLSDEDDTTFYKQIAKEDRYVFGWDDWYPDRPPNHSDAWLDWDPYGPLPEPIPTTSANRETFRNLLGCSH
jgi:hypothetical protein